MQKKQQKTHSIPEWTPNEAQQKFNCAKTDICLQLIERWVWFCWEDFFTSLKTHIPLLKWECAWICLSKLIHEKFYKGAKKPPANAKIHKKKALNGALLPWENRPSILPASFPHQKQFLPLKPWVEFPISLKRKAHETSPIHPYWNSFAHFLCCPGCDVLPKQEKGHGSPVAHQKQQATYGMKAACL